MTFVIAVFTAVVAVGASSVCPAAQGAAGLSVSTHDAAPPDTLAGPIAGELSPGGVRAVVSKGPVTLDFWWVAALPMKAGSGQPSWADLEEGTLVGAVNVAAEFRDVRGRVIKPGVYTLRYGIQPSDGDHLGVSPYREFLLLSPAAVDLDPVALGHDGTIALSKQAIGGSHPGVWSIDPPVAQQAPLQIHRTEFEHDAVIVEVPVNREGKPAGALRFGVVLIGRIEA